MKAKSILLTSSLLLLTSASAAEYTLTGTRYLRKYTAPGVSPVYMAETDVQRIANTLCDVPWEKTEVARATATTHVTTNLDWNVKNRNRFDAALFCANHVGDEHVAYANAACYRFEMPEGVTLPSVTNIEITVYSDPYNAYGARISIIASDSDTIPTACATVRGDVEGGIKAAGVCKRVTRTSGTTTKAYPNTTNVVFKSSSVQGVQGVQELPSGGLPLKKYLYVFVLMENYATSRGEWIEGCSYIENAIKIKTAGDVPGWSGGCDIAEPYATTYHLKDGHAGEDWDGDGLSNYAEYLISEVFKFARLDPDNPKTDGSCVDYYRKHGDLYFGEMFVGMKSSSVQGVQGVLSGSSGGLDAPETLRVRTTYWKRRRVEAQVIVQAWNAARDGEMTSDPEETYVGEKSVVNGERVMTLTREESKSMCLAAGGRYKAVAFADEDGDGKFTPGEPFAFIRDLRLFATETPIPLTDDTPIFARLDLLSGAYAADGSAVTVATSNTTAGVTEKARHTRVRAVRALVDGRPILGYDEWGQEVPVKEVVLDKYLDLGTRSYLHEGDFLTDGAFDVGWATTQENVYDRDVVATKDDCDYAFIDATNITYGIFVGDGEIGNVTNSVYQFLVTRSYDSSDVRRGDVKPEPDKAQPKGYVYGARPTFRWAMRGTNGTEHATYSAFKIQTRSGQSVVYDSGMRDLPLRDAAGWYVWTLDEPIGTAVPTSGPYTWRVSMYNAKYRDDTFWNAKSSEYSKPQTIVTWSGDTPFVVDINKQQEMNDHGYSSIAAAVKYAGPSTVLTNGRVVLQAFDNPYFEGVPAGQTYATNKNEIADTAHNTANAVIRGLPAEGTYYLRAFIDGYSNNTRNGQLDDYESWGCAKYAVALSGETLTMPTVGIWIEDADTDGDWIPDAYEYAVNGNLTTLGGGSIQGDKIKFNGNWSSTGTAGISRGLSGASLTTFQKSNHPLIAADMSYYVSIDAIRGSVEYTLNPSTVQVTAVTLSPDGSKVTLALSSYMTDSIAGKVLGQYFNITSGSSATVTVKVYKKNTLAEAGWTLVCTTNKTFSRDEVEVDVAVTGVNMTNGYYKVEVEQ